MRVNPRLREALAFVRAEQARESPRAFIPHEPHAKQAEFLALDCLEALYGGAAGGGKSDALLMAALKYVHVPGYAALLLRRKFTDLVLPDALIPRALSWLSGTGAKWNSSKHEWTFPSGATLTFGYCDSAQDVYRYQGAAVQFIGIDELTQWPDGPYKYLLSRLRRLEGSAVPVRVRCSANPGGIGHEWVKRRFVDSTDAGRQFVPALLVDNPSLDASEYRKSLAQLDETTRRQLEDGIWLRDSGGLVYQYDESRNAAPAPASLTHTLIGIDYGYTDATAFTVLGWRDNDPCVYVVEAYKKRGLTPSDAADEALALSTKYKPVKMVGDVGGLGKGYAEEARRRFNLPIEPAEKTNKRGYQSLFNGDLERGRIKVDPAKCSELVAEWLELPWTEDHQKEADGFDNHCLVAGTNVETVAGPVPVELLRPGVQVHTRQGPRTVNAAAQTRRARIYVLRTAGGRTLEGTADHPVFTERGWVPLATLMPGDTLSVWASTGRVNGSCSRARCFVATRTRRIAHCAPTSQAREGAGCTVSCGRLSAGQSRRATTSTTSTRTRSTTACATYASSRDVSTFGSTPLCRSASPCLAGPSKRPLPPLQPGTPRLPGLRGMPSKVAIRGGIESRSPVPVSSATARSSPRSPAPRSAEVLVTRSDDATPGLTTKTVLAPGAALPSGPAGTAGNLFVRDRVLLVERTQRVEPVYNLSVANVPEYFANGILVHNCADATLYSWRAASAYHEAPEPPLPTREQVIRQNEAELWERRAEAVERRTAGPWWEE